MKPFKFNIPEELKGHFDYFVLEYLEQCEKVQDQLQFIPEEDRDTYIERYLEVTQEYDESPEFRDFITYDEWKEIQILEKKKQEECAAIHPDGCVCNICDFRRQIIEFTTMNYVSNFQTSITREKPSSPLEQWG
jgi:hypothetical protein